ncbi:MAG: hypothetical protein O2895_00270 [Chloroflexi bacterium]|nr:hypothetical protein [Chloroflexota bacterium]
MHSITARPGADTAWRGLPYRRVSASLLALALVLVAACGGGDEFPELEPFPPELDNRMAEIRAGAAETRGLAPGETIEQGTLTRQRYEDYLRKRVGVIEEEQRRELEAYNTAFRLLHLIGDDEDLLESSTQIDASGVLGFYNLEDDLLVLIDADTEITRSEELTLAHEYVHSFQDAAFDLDSWDALVEAESQDGAPLTEYSTTLHCLLEGDASIAGDQYAAAQWGADWRDAVAAEDAGGDGAAVADVSPALLRYAAFNYVQCEDFVAALHASGGWDAVDRAYAQPPTTTEQILHYEKCEAGEQATELPRVDLTERLGGTWEEMFGGAFGEFDVYNHLLSVTGDSASAAGAAEGWGAGWLTVYRSSNGTSAAEPSLVVHISTEWDTAFDLLEYTDMLGIVVDLVSEGQVEVVTEDGPVRWQGDGEWGYISWDERAKRIDLLVASAPEALDVARTAVLTHAITVAGDAGAGGLEAREPRVEDLPGAAAVAREDHVRAAGTVAAFERAFEPSGNASTIELGGSTAISIESHVAAYASVSEATLAQDAAREGLSDHEAGELLTRLLGVNIGPESYQQVTLELPLAGLAAAGRLSMGRHRLDVTWVRLQHEETVGTLVVMSASDALHAADIGPLADAMMPRLMAPAGSVDLGALRPVGIFDEEDVPADTEEFVRAVVDAIFRQPNWDAIVDWSAPQLIAEPGYEETPALAVAITGPLLGEYGTDAVVTIALRLEDSAEPVAAVQCSLFGEFEQGGALLDLTAIEQDGELQLAGWFVQLLE